MLKDEIEEFLRSYIEAFEGVDGKAIANLYHLPSVTVRGDGTIHQFTEFQYVEEFMGNVAQVYYDEGLRTGYYEDLVVVPVGGESAFITLRWINQREDGTTAREWAQSYNLIRTDDSWKFLLSTFHR